MTSTSYDWSTHIIQSIEALTILTRARMSAAVYSEIFQRALILMPDASLSDKHGIQALIHQLTWMHRAYRKSFPGDEGRLKFCHHDGI